MAHQAPLSMGFPRQEHWNGLPFPSPRDLPDRGIELRAPALQVDSLPSEPPRKLFLLSQQKDEQVAQHCGQVHAQEEGEEHALLLWPDGEPQEEEL